MMKTTTTPSGESSFASACVLRWSMALILGLGTLAAVDADTPPAQGRSPQAAQPGGLDPQVQVFIDDMVVRNGFDREALTRLFEAAEIRNDILQAIAKPAEAKPWYQYRQIFLNAPRIDAGLEFWNANADALARAQAIYGVPPEVVVAIIGVETRYGQNAGRYPVLDALSTLAFHYPPRGSYFRSELEQFLLLTREERLDPATLKGSYAGAMGMGQFMPSSFRAYVVDFDNDGKRDPWSSAADAIGSVAHYLAEHGWERGGPIAAPLSLSDSAQPLPTDAAGPRNSLKALKALGARVDGDLPEDTPAAVVTLEEENGPEYWAGFHDFYVITRYNHSPLYAMAVTQLGTAIRSQREHRGRGL
jgi:membrane-bound lytic murein transglycosylase B